MTTITSQSPQETKTIAVKILEALVSDTTKAGTATIVALQGDLGAGKTVFAKGVAEYLGIKETVTSPTFVIEKLYHVPEGHPWETLVHIDAYRLEGEEDLGAINWSTLATDPKKLILIEWPEQVGRGIPERALWIKIEVVDEKTRKITIPKQLSVDE